MRSLGTVRRSIALFYTVTLSLSAGVGCRRPHHLRIAAIPRTTGTQLWESEHYGIEAAAHAHGMEVYWNAPTREDDVERQIALVERMTDEHYDALILAPDQALALISPVRRALDRGMRVVVISSSLPIAPQPNLHFILNDDAESGRLAAQRIGTLLGGKGSVAILGVDTKLTSIMRKVEAFKQVLGAQYPGVEIVAIHPGAFNHSQAQQIALDTLTQHPALRALFAMTTSATQGAFEALNERHDHSVKLVGCEQDLDLEDSVRTGQIDALLIENTYAMGFGAVEWINDPGSAAQSPPVQLRPLLLAKDNFAQIQKAQYTKGNWGPQ